MQTASTTAECQVQFQAENTQKALTMPFSSHHPERSSSSQSIPLLPAKAYVPPSSDQDSTESSNSFIDAHVEHEAMPTEDEIKDATTKPRSSSTSTTSSFALSNDSENGDFIPPANMKE